MRRSIETIANNLSAYASLTIDLPLPVHSTVSFIIKNTIRQFIAEDILKSIIICDM